MVVECLGPQPSGANARNAYRGLTPNSAPLGMHHLEMPTVSVPSGCRASRSRGPLYYCKDTIKFTAIISDEHGPGYNIRVSRKPGAASDDKFGPVPGEIRRTWRTRRTLESTLSLFKRGDVLIDHRDRPKLTAAWTIPCSLITRTLFPSDQMRWISAPGTVWSPVDGPCENCQTVGLGTSVAWL